MTNPDETPQLLLVRLADHLARAGWQMVDQDRRTVVFRTERNPDLVVVLPWGYVPGTPLDLTGALRTVAFEEQRTLDELRQDLAFDGGADTVSLRLTPEDVPSGSAPMGVLRQAVEALRELVIGSAAGLDTHDLVLPSRRPPRAENYAERTLISTDKGSFVLRLALPRIEIPGDTSTIAQTFQLPLVDVPPQPFGTRLISRMRRVAERSVELAQQVGDGDQPLRAFATPDTMYGNATELSALANLGGPERGRYRLRFSEAPLGDRPRGPSLLVVTPAQQQTLGEAASFLRERLPRSGVTVFGLVVRLHRDGNSGPGDISVLGPSDDSGTARRFQMELTEEDYAAAMRAHSQGLQVTATGDMEVRGTRTYLRRLTLFSVLPGLL